MATLEQVALALDAVLNLKNLRRDITENVKDYERRIASGQSEADVLAMAKQNAAEYARRLEWHNAGDVSSELEAGVAALGIDDYQDEIIALSETTLKQLEAKDLKELKTEARKTAERKVLFKAK